MMNSMMTTTVMQTSRAKRLVRMLERLLKQDHLYTDEQIKTMKKQLRVVREELAAFEANKSKGFGK